MIDFLSQIEGELNTIFQSNTFLDKTGAHLCLASNAKRVRPLLVSYFAEILGLSKQKIIPIAVATELIHSASLLHDDGIDNADSRRGRPSVNHQWSNSVAVLSGNYLLSCAFIQLRSFGHEMTQEVIDVVSKMTQAAMLELQMRRSLDFTIEDWRAMAIGKTGSLFAFCGSSVALLMGHQEAHKAFTICGHHIGQIFQLADDICDLQEDEDNEEASFPRLLMTMGNQDPLPACREELLKQTTLAMKALEPWKSSAGSNQIKMWLEQLSSLGNAR